MNKRDIKKIVLAQLSNMLRGEVIIDGIVEDGDMARAWDAQEELAKEFEKRGAGVKYAEAWDYDDSQPSHKPIPAAPL